MRQPRFEMGEKLEPGVEQGPDTLNNRYPAIKTPETNGSHLCGMTFVSLVLIGLSVVSPNAFALQTRNFQTGEFQARKLDSQEVQQWVQDERIDSAIQDSTPPWFNAETGQMRPITEFSRSVDLHDADPSANRRKAAYYVDWWSLYIQPILDWIYDWFVGWWWPSSWTWGEYWPYVILGIIVVIVLGIAVYLIMQMEQVQVMLGRNGAEARTKRRKKATVEDLPFELEGITLSVDDLLSRAQLERKNGNFRMAIVYLFSHLLLVLDRKEFILLTKGKTNRNYLVELREHRQVRPFFRHIMTAFEQVFFGQYQMTESEVETLFKEAESLGLQ